MSQETRPSVHWPPVQWEEWPWKSAMAGALGVPRRARADHEGPYRSAVLVPIASLDVVLPGAVTALADDASTQIARFDAGLEGDITPFAAVLLRSESASSSRIENLTSGAEDLARAEIGAATTSNAELVVGNVRGMQAAIALADRLDGDSILAMHAALLEEHEPHLAGRWRDQQVWIGGTGFGPHLAAFVPPHHDRVPAAIGDLVAFVRRDDLPVLVQAAVAHAQFETIHPFPDGNGRTGRALLHAMLAAKGLTRNVTVPISAGLLSDTRSYFDALTAFRDGDLTPIVERVSHAAFSAMSNGALLVAELRAVRAGWDALITARRDAAVHRLADVVLRQPVLDVAVAVHRLGVSPVAAQNAVDALVRIGALQAIGDRRRNRLWQAPEVTAALDAFAVRAGRRG